MLLFYFINHSKNFIFIKTLKIIDFRIYIANANKNILK